MVSVCLFKLRKILMNQLLIVDRMLLNEEAEDTTSHIHAM